MSKLFVIPGHGAGDPGACANGYKEAERVRVLAQKIKDYGGDNVLLADFNRDYYADKGILNLTISKDYQILELHMDSDTPSAKGGHVIINSIYNPDAYDTALANFIGSVLPGRSEKIKKRSDIANCKRAATMGYGYRLVECGFITNANDLNFFNSHLDDLAKGILKCFNIGTNNKPTTTPPVEESKPQSTKYKVGQHVTFSSCFISSADASTCDPALTVKCSVNHGVISEVKIINGVTVYNLSGICWVNNGDIRGLYNEPSKPVDNWVSRLDAECKKQGFTGYPTVKKGAKGNITKLIQERLNSVGFNLNVDGSFGNNTEYAVQVFQRNRNLSDDGVVGANTWRYLVDGKSYYYAGKIKKQCQRYRCLLHST